MKDAAPITIFLLLWSVHMLDNPQGLDVLKHLRPRIKGEGVLFASYDGKAEDSAHMRPQTRH